ncbi:hypothetical protein AbraCBS73388_008732 [Aspergillus brasiliensis]|uniref:FAD-binding domain-containing protein n=1 Tax=Aspergillus brasiliensis TaxID=319629 RepID=A0A9W5YUR5_9EURO|nr:hypothetical protein AbraCBS73388_008732 [Aspergillus brasiliensis]
MGDRENTIIDGVLRFPRTGLDVLIVGCGLAGMMAAIEWDIVAIGPSAWANLQKYPSMLEEWNRISIDCHTTFHYLDGRRAREPMEFEYNREIAAQHAAYPLRVRSVLGRAHLALMLLNQCKRLNIPITWNVPIVAYEEEAEIAVAISEDGRRFSGDIVIAADGIGSKSHGVVLGHPVRAIGTGYTCYRVMVSTESFKTVPSVQKALCEQERPEVRVYNGQNLHCVFVLSPTIVSVILTRKEKDDDDSAIESWASTVSSDRVLAGISDIESWDPLLIDIIRMSPEARIVRWKLCMRNPQRKWTSSGGRIVQIGDSAHSFIPTSANGACMALEDGASLAECLRIAGKENCADGAKVHELLRYQRVTVIQRTGFANRRELHRPTDELPKNIEDLMRQGKWIWCHNPERYATENYTQAHASLKSGAPFQNTNLPPGHKFEDWTLEDEVEKEKMGIAVPDLKQNGDWSIV